MIESHSEEQVQGEIEFEGEAEEEIEVESEVEDEDEVEVDNNSISEKKDEEPECNILEAFDFMRHIQNFDGDKAKNVKKNRQRQKQVEKLQAQPKETQQQIEQNILKERPIKLSEQIILKNIEQRIDPNILT